MNYQSLSRHHLLRYRTAMEKDALIWGIRIIVVPVETCRRINGG
ncbi:MAG: hypothetical protein WCP55_12710 [Lentisphaerota bacterium]|jgi:hypothetical protein